jgi:quercetin dioxygenase-like cupin family protein
VGHRGRFLRGEAGWRAYSEQMATERPIRTRGVAGLAVALLTIVTLAACGGGDEEPTPAGSDSAVVEGAAGEQMLLDRQALDVLDQQVGYPKKQPAQVTSMITTLEPGQESGWHRARVPLYVYVLEGAISVEYDPGVMKEFSAGTAYMDAEDIWNNVTNNGDATARMLLVYMGAEGKKNSVDR